MNLAPITVAVHSIGRDSRRELISDVRKGLSQAPKTLPSHWFYDDSGCDLFEQITELPEYYQTRTEMAILSEYSQQIVEMTSPASIVELGAGACTKSRVLIEAAKGRATLRTFMPFDISETTIRRAAADLVEAYGDVSIYCIVGEFDKHLDQIPRLGDQLIVFLGGTIGNFTPVQRAGFLNDVRSLSQPGDAFLLGLDLVKPEADLIGAYQDAAGVTARFNLNLLTRINRELGAGFDPASFEHLAVWNREHSRVEMHLRSRHRQIVALGAAGEAQFDAGETIRTEICTKYTRDDVERMLAAAGFAVSGWFTDPERRFALVLAM